MSDVPSDVLELAAAVTNAAEAVCREKRFVYGFGTGNAKGTLDLHIAAAIMAERERAAACCHTALDPNTFVMTGPAGLARRIEAAIRRGTP